jgi:Nucleotide modification associated domain 2
MRLYTYCLRYDDGAAPNPYWGICTLVICKPAIRRTAEIGDWIVGLGSANSPIGDISDCVVYAMKVTDKMTMRGYDEYCASKYPKKIPDWRNRTYSRRMGDCMYDYKAGAIPKLRWGIHNEDNKIRDLSGKYALISKHYYYFGDHPIKLPHELRSIIHDTQGHKVDLNQPYVESFVNWIENLDYRPNKILGEPQLKKELSRSTDFQAKCSIRDLEEDIC